MTPNADMLGRKEAAVFLDISTRTLDRYVRGKKLNPVRKKGKLFFRHHELESIKAGQEVQTPHIVPKSTELSSPANEKDQSGGKYKVLWEATKSELEKKEKLLMNLHHRLGFLESELKQSVPLLESQNEQASLKKKISTQQQKIISLQQKAHRNMIGRRLFFVLFLLSITGGFLLLLSRL